MNYQIGQHVTAKFTNNFNVIRFYGEIVKVNKNTVLVKSLEDGVNEWEKGHIFSIATERSPIYSKNNCIEIVHEC